MNLDLGTSIVHGLLICIPFTIFVAVTFITRPRLWLHSLPPSIQASATPKTEREINITRYLLLPIFLLILPGLSLLSTINVIQDKLPSFTIYDTIIHLYVIWIIVHLWDLVVIDGLAMLIIDPASPPIHGTKNAKGWKGYGFHVRSFLLAVRNSALFVVPAGAITFWLMSFQRS